MTSFVQKILVDSIVTICDVPHYYIHCNGIIYHTEVYEETFNVNSKIAQTTQIFKSSMSER